MTGLSHQQRIRLMSILKKVGVIKFGNFTLKDGSTSKIYIDMRILPNFPLEFIETIDLASVYLGNTGILNNTDCFIAPPLAGVPLATALSLSLHKPYFLARMEPKAYGTKKQIEGNITGKTILVIDDVITSGGSKQPIIKAIRDQGGFVNYIFVFVNRMKSNEELADFEVNNSLQVHYLLSLEMIDGLR
ncbi:MAG: orotate phosphoribosyltransferase [Candidatus Thorarchaeota archaeon]